MTPTPGDGYPKLDLTTPVQEIAAQGLGIDALTRLASGNPHLVTNPDLLGALAKGNASPMEAGTINSFMAGLKTQALVENARHLGQPIVLNDDERSLLDNMGVQYQDVYQTPQQALAALNVKAAAQNMQVAVDKNGNALFNPDGTPVLVAKTNPAAAHHHGGFWNGFGHVMSDIGKPLSLVATNVASQVNNLFRGKPTPAGSSQNVVATAQSGLAEDMQAAGYNPDNIFSIASFQAAGKSYLDTSGVAQDFDNSHPNGVVDPQGGPVNLDGAAVVKLAKEFITNPAKVSQDIAANAGLTPQQRGAQLAFLSSPDFEHVVQEVNGRKATLGDAVLGSLGVDPAKEQGLYRYGGAGIDLAAGFALDPVLWLGNAVEAGKLASVGLKAFHDGSDPNRIRDILLSQPSIFRPWQGNVQRGMQRFIDNANGIRSATEAGDDAALAAHYADIRATTPALEPVLGDFTGGDRILMGEDGQPLRDANGRPVIGKGDPITNMQEAADYLSSKAAFGRLMSGRAAIEWNLMPGALSSFGYRALVKARGATRVGKAAEIRLQNYQDALKVLPWINDAVDESGQVVAASHNLEDAQAALDAATQSGQGVNEAQARLNEATQGLASAQRAARANLVNDARLQGEVQANLLRRGTVDANGWNLARYASAQADRAARRLSSFLPRNGQLELHGAGSTDKVYKFLQLYMSRSDAALGAARWAAGDEGVRRTMAIAIQAQVMHAAGYGASEAGRAELDNLYRLADNPLDADADLTQTHQYAVNGEDIFGDPRFGGKQVHLGIMPSDANDTWWLDSFGKLSQDAARMTLWSRVWGRTFNSQIANVMTYAFKTFQLMKPSTWTRNMVEGLGNAAFRGELGAVLRAKAAAIEAGAYPARGVTSFLNQKMWGGLRAKLHLTPMATVGRWYRHAALRMAAEHDGLDYIARLPSDELVQWIHDFATQHMRADLDPAGLLQTRKNLEEGLAQKPFTADLQHPLSPYRAAKGDFQRTGFAPESADGLIGAERWAGELAKAVNEFPEHAKALMGAARRDNGDISEVLKTIEEDPQLKARIASLRASSLYQRPDGTFNTAYTAEEKQAALEALVRRQVSNMKHLMNGRGGDEGENYLHDIEDYVRTHDRAPNASWLMDHVKDEERPASVMAPKFVAVPKDQSEGGFARTLANGFDRMYKALVEDPIHHTTSMPVFLANYGRARYAFADEEEAIRQHILDVGGRALVEKGLKGDDLKVATAELHDKAEVTADALAKRYAVQMAWTRTEQIIDDPGLKTQFDIVGRNFFMYSRATQAMIRRWGQAIIQNPFRLERAALALHAAEHSGLIYKDKYGELQFMYPASGPLIQGVSKAAGAIPGFGGFAQLPMMPDVSGKVIFAAPGLDNPLKMGASPLVNVPYRLIEKYAGHLSPQLGIDMDRLDRFWNGPVGAGQIGTNFEPTGLRNLFAALNENDRKGQLASAVRNGFTNLYAADPTGAKGIFPTGPGISDEKQQQFQDRVKIQARNNLIARWALGLFAPAPPSQPTMSTSGSKEDFAFSPLGIRNLRDEYTQILNDLGGDYQTANQIWAEMHPDKLIYETSQSHGTAKGVTLPAGQSTFNWIEKNLPFMEKYKATAAYFLPQTQEQFSNQAYQEEFHLGLRQYYSTSDWFKQVLINTAANEYWPSQQAYTAAETKLKQAGDSAGAQQLQYRHTIWEKNFLDQNPVFATDLSTAADANQGAARAVLSNLKDMVNDPNLPSTVPVKGVKQMLDSYNAYTQWANDNPGVSSAVKAHVLDEYGQYMLNLGESNPALMSLYNGVFRKLTQKLPQGA